jgi:RNA polymerase subunit RPABC4/transcription elongation factor Spt4
MSFCTNCGSEITPGAKFCGSCGKEQITSAVVCPKCNKTLEENEKFCSSCGTPSNAFPKVTPKPKAESRLDPSKPKLTKEGKNIIDGGPKPVNKRPAKKSPATKPAQKSKSSEKRKSSSIGCFFRTIFILASIVIGAAILIYVANIFIEDSGNATPSTQETAKNEEGQLTGTDIPGIVDIEPEKKANKGVTNRSADKKLIDVNDENRADKYKYGIDVNNDQYKAFEIYEKLADKGDPDAMVHLSDYYEQGIWVKKDIKKAKKLLQQAAEKGSQAAEWQLEYLNSTN